ncbi:MAG: hypothetical protein HY062_07410 [Bacteroidetes bacterium]|nr:hypothetical protein [Bacteroidota bacterium]
MKTEKIYTQHEENKEWASKLAFYKDEIRIMENRLAEIAQKNTSKEILAQTERFQNQLIIQKNQIDEISHLINLDNDTINREINKNSIAVDHRKINDHSELRDRINTFETLIGSLKVDFNTFLSKWM